MLRWFLQLLRLSFFDRSLQIILCSFLQIFPVVPTPVTHSWTYRYPHILIIFHALFQYFTFMNMNVICLLHMISIFMNPTSILCTWYSSSFIQKTCDIHAKTCKLVENSMKFAFSHQKTHPASNPRIILSTGYKPLLTSRRKNQILMNFANILADFPHFGIIFAFRQRN